MYVILVILIVLAVWALSLLVRPTKACGSCARRRRRGPCGRCKGTGRVLRVGARLVHRQAVKGHQEARRRWGR